MFENILFRAETWDLFFFHVVNMTWIDWTVVALVTLLIILLVYCLLKILVSNGLRQLREGHASRSIKNK